MPTAPGRPPFRDNTPLLLVGIVALLTVTGVLLVLANRSSTLAPDFLTDFVLYALSATNLTILVALAFMLARNIVKLVVERRRGLPFARFRAKLVAVLLTMALVPAVLVMIVGSEVIRNSVDRWFNAPMDEVLSSANAIAGDYYEERQRLVAAEARRLARTLATSRADTLNISALVESDIDEQRVGLLEVFIDRSDAGITRIDTLAAEASSSVPARAAGTGEALAARAVDLSEELTAVERLEGDEGDLIRAAVPFAFAGGDGVGVVVATDYLAGAFVARARSMTSAYEDYQQLRVLRQPLAGVYQSFFLMLTLMILVAATWMGLYLAKRITRPVLMLSAAAREVGAGRLEQRLVAETQDEFGTLIEEFNRMASDVAADRQRLEQSATQIEHRHQEVEARRQYVETVLNGLTTGVVSVDAFGTVQSANAAAGALLSQSAIVGQAAGDVFRISGLPPLDDAMTEAARSHVLIGPRDVVMTREGRDTHLTVTVTPLDGDKEGAGGLVLMLEDVTPLVRAQRMAAWREVAKRLAHEIKNPLTPIQLCAERVRRHFADAPARSRALVDECVTTIVGEVESLKSLVNEFSQFARLPSPRAEPTDADQLIQDVLALYRGLFAEVEIRVRISPDIPLIAMDGEQIRRVLVNLIDNAVEAMEQRGVIEIAAKYDSATEVLRITVADNGPGIPPEHRDRLFSPQHSTKDRGSGLGLAIVRRIVAEHGGEIVVSDNHPHGARFTVELPRHARQAIGESAEVERAWRQF